MHRYEEVVIGNQRIRKAMSRVGKLISALLSRRPVASSFDAWQAIIRTSTVRQHDAILNWALAQSKIADDNLFHDCSDPIVILGQKLRRENSVRFRDELCAWGGRLRILVHVPDLTSSPGGYSAFSNLVSGLKFLGIPASPLKWKDSTRESLEVFSPSCLITSDHTSYLERIDWKAIDEWRERHGLLIGLTASLQEYGNTPLDERLTWARNNGVDFYYSFRTPEYVNGRKEYGEFRSAGYPIFSVEFGANPAHYFPVPRKARDLDYVFLASSNPDKQIRYTQFLTRIFQRHTGFIDGPGWRNVNRFAPPESHRFLYSRARVGINLHISDSVKWPCELNERTYILAACGIPQVVDNALLLPNRFSEGALYIARNPEEYYDSFVSILEDPGAAERRAMKALEQVYRYHTTYQRAEGFARDVCAHFNIGPTATV